MLVAPAERRASTLRRSAAAQLGGRAAVRGLRGTHAVIAQLLQRTTPPRRCKARRGGGLLLRPRGAKRAAFPRASPPSWAAQAVARRRAVVVPQWWASAAAAALGGRECWCLCARTVNHMDCQVFVLSRRRCPLLVVAFGHRDRPPGEAVAPAAVIATKPPTASHLALPPGGGAGCCPAAVGSAAASRRQSSALPSACFPRLACPGAVLLAAGGTAARRGSLRSSAPDSWLNACPLPDHGCSHRSPAAAGAARAGLLLPAAASCRTPPEPAPPASAPAHWHPSTCTRSSTSSGSAWSPAPAPSSGRQSTQSRPPAVTTRNEHEDLYLLSARRRRAGALSALLSAPGAHLPPRHVLHHLGLGLHGFSPHLDVTAVGQMMAVALRALSLRALAGSRAEAARRGNCGQRVMMSVVFACIYVPAPGVLLSLQEWNKRCTGRILLRLELTANRKRSTGVRQPVFTSAVKSVRAGDFMQAGSLAGSIDGSPGDES